MIKNPSLKFSLCLFVFCFVLICVSADVEAAALYLIPQSRAIYQGDSFLVNVMVDTEGEDINVAEVHLLFPLKILKPIGVAEGDSVLTLFTRKPEIKGGEVDFVGGVPQGFNGSGLLAKIILRGENVGQGRLTFQSNSQVLLNDGRGTPAQLSFRAGNYTVEERPEELVKITSDTHPDQNKWYKNKILHLHWDIDKGAEYSYLLSRDALAEPDMIPDKPKGKLMWLGDMQYNLEGERDGIYYFHLRESRETGAKSGGEAMRKWRPKVTFRAMIDSTPPEDFKPQISRDPRIYNGKYFLSFAGRDRTSGIDHYEVREAPRMLTLITAKKGWKIARSPYLLEDQKLRSKILVKAVDRAGNERVEEVSSPTPLIPYGIILVGVVIAAGVVLAIIRRRRRGRGVKA